MSEEASDFELQLARKTRRRNLILLTVILTVVIVLVGFFAYYWITYSPPPEEFTVTIVPNPTVSLTTSQSQQFNSTVTGGNPPYTYQWVLNNVAVSVNGTSPSWTFKPHPAGTYSVYLNVTDLVGFVAQSNIVTVTVHT
jgi:hypothetical protein